MIKRLNIDDWGSGIQVPKSAAENMVRKVLQYWKILASENSETSQTSRKSSWLNGRTQTTCTTVLTAKKELEELAQ